MAITYPLDKANQRMPEGKYKNRLVRKVPLTYLQWLNTQGSSNTLYQWLYNSNRG